MIDVNTAKAAILETENLNTLIGVYQTYGAELGGDFNTVLEDGEIQAHEWMLVDAAAALLAPELVKKTFVWPDLHIVIKFDTQNLEQVTVANHIFNNLTFAVGSCGHDDFNEEWVETIYHPKKINRDPVAWLFEANFYPLS